MRAPPRALVWVIWDRKRTKTNPAGRVYLVLPFVESRGQAIGELEKFLRPYPHGHDWRVRLVVKEIPARRGVRGPQKAA